MILKAKERGDAPQLARYLLSLRDNEHVELHEVSGFVSDDLSEAFQEADAIARGTRCKNHLFSISLNPPQGAYVEPEVFERTADRIEKKLGLENQPRAIVFHEKEGRRHAHVVWSRIDTDRMRAINLSHYKSKLRDISRELFLENDWDLPRGLQDRALRDPLNFTQQEWQQAKRAGLDVRELKSVLQQCWKASDNQSSFEQALKERGFWLARGDRRGYVAIDYRGEVYSLSRYVGVKSQELGQRLAARDKLPSVDEVKREIARAISPKLEVFIKNAEREAKRRVELVEAKRVEITKRHQQDRKSLSSDHEKRWLAETKERSERLPRGLSGVRHRLTGRYAAVKAFNERETLQAWQRDRAEKDDLILKQTEERRVLQAELNRKRSVAQEEMLQLRKDVANYRDFERQVAEHEREKEERARSRRSSRSRRSLDR